MTERAQAMEAAKRVSDWIERQSVARDASEYSKGWRVGAQQAVEEYRAALAVQPPPPVGSPTTQIDVVCHECGGRGGEYWHEPDGGVNGQKCGVCNGFGHVLASEPPSAFTLGQEFVSRVTSSNAPEGPSVIGPIERDEELVTFALELAVATLGAEGCACQPEEPCALCMCKEAVAHLRDTSPAPVSPVEPTPEPTKKTFQPVEGCDCYLCRDARSSEAPTGEPAPCVWREVEIEGWESGCQSEALSGDEIEDGPPKEWPFCPYCGSPLKVER